MIQALGPRGSFADVFQRHGPPLPATVSLDTTPGMAATTNIPPAFPAILVSLAIEPRTFVLNKPEQVPTISLTATSHASLPITILTWPTIFHLKLGQKRRNFNCLDLTTDSLLQIEITKGPRRPSFSREKGRPDEEYFLTLEPGVPRTFEANFGLAHPGRDILVAGHRYRYNVSEGEKVSWWRYGTKDEVMSPPGKSCGLGEASGDEIHLDIEPVEFEVVHDT